MHAHGILCSSDRNVNESNKCCKKIDCGCLLSLFCIDNSKDGSHNDANKIASTKFSIFSSSLSFLTSLTRFYALEKAPAI